MPSLNIFPRTAIHYLAMIIASLFVISPVWAQTASGEISSAYTKLNLDDCRLLTQADLGLPELSEEELGVGSVNWLCPGYGNTIVYVAEGDLRMFVSYGQNAMQERAANQTLPAFNTIGETLEWRVQRINGNWVPFATILRWRTQIGDGSLPDGEILIVTKLEPGNTCHVAYIDAKMTPNANQVARNFADSEVAGFDCTTDDTLLVPS